MMAEQTSLKLSMVFKGYAAKCVNAALERGINEFIAINTFAPIGGTEIENRVYIKVWYSPEYAQIAHEWLTSKPNPMILSYEISRR